MADKWISEDSSEAELKSAVSAFEQILEVEPNDRLALETLGTAHTRLGDPDKAASYLLRLAEVVTNENDAKGAVDLIRILRTLPPSEVITGTVKKLQALAGKTGRGDTKRATAQRSHDITREISLAWDLLQAEQISQEDYAGIVHNLSENSAKAAQIDVPITVLHALQDRQHRGLEKVIAYLGRTSGKPVIPVQQFEITQELLVMLPIEYMSQRGAILFEKMGQDLLVAVLNPFDTELQQDIREETGRRCHFYVTGPAQYDAALINIRKSLAMLNS